MCINSMIKFSIDIGELNNGTSYIAGLTYHFAYTSSLFYNTYIQIYCRFCTSNNIYKILLTYDSKT